LDESPPIERQSDREQVFVKARCRTSRWHVGDASLSDISAHGCCIVTRATLVKGQSIDIRYGSNKGLPATVRWVKELSAGVEFDTPLEQGDLEELLSEHRQSSSKVSRIPLKDRQFS
jgi:PilZ domain